MLSTLGGFLNRHKKKFIFTGVLIGGTTLAINYAQRRLREWQEAETKAFLNTTRRKLHFESTERNCNQTILSLVTSLSESIMRCLDSQKILSQLSSNPSNKAELWEELKIMTLARATSVIYAFTILVITSRIQLNILGGYLYKHARDDSLPEIDNEFRIKYLSFCNYFVSEGIEKLCRQIHAQVRTTIAPIPLKRKLALKEMEQLFWSVQASLCFDINDPLKQLVSFLMVGDEQYTYSEALLKTMTHETMDLLESNEVLSLCNTGVRRSFSLLFDNIAEYFSPLSSPTNGRINGEAHISEECMPLDVVNDFVDKSHLNSYVSVNNMEVPFIKLIPIINALISAPTDSGLSGAQRAIIEQLILNEKIKILGANIYEVFSSSN